MIRRQVRYALIVSAAVLFVACACIPIFFAHAQSGTPGSAGIKVAPAIIENRIDPGKTFSDTIHVTNLESKTQTFYVLVRNIKSLGPDGQPVFAKSGEATGFELSDWVKPGVDHITLAAGQEGDVPFTVNVPANASPGGHFGGIFLSALPPKERTNGAGVGYQVGTIMNFRISGDIVENAQIREFSTDKLLYSGANVAFTVEVENTGNVLVRPRGPIDITDMFGKKVATIKINDEGGAVLPKARRKFTATWKGDGFSFGRYQAIVALAYGEDGRKTISAAESFWVLPLKVILPVGGGLLVLILLAYGLMRWYLRRRIADMYRNSRHLSRGGRARGSASVERMRAPMPKLAVVAIAVLSFTMVFLIVMFLFLA